MWRKGNSRALLVEMQIDAATMENSMEFPLKTKTKNRTKYDPAISLLGIYLKKKKTLIQKDT